MKLSGWFVVGRQPAGWVPVHTDLIRQSSWGMSVYTDAGLWSADFAEARGSVLLYARPCAVFAYRLLDKCMWVLERIAPRLAVKIAFLRKDASRIQGAAMISGYHADFADDPRLLDGLTPEERKALMEQ